MKLRISNDPQDADALVLLARLIYLQTMDVDEAFKYLNQARAVTPQSMSLTAAKVSILKAEDRTDEAIAILDERVQQEGSFIAYLMRAVYLAGAGKDELAENDYLKLTALSNRSAEGYLLLSRFYSARDRIDEAVAALEKGAAEHDDDLTIRRELMKALFARDSDDDRRLAMEILSDLETRLPDDPGLMLLQTKQLLGQASPQSTELAREILKRIVLIEPSSITAHMSLVDIAMKEEKFADARDIAIRGAGANPRDISLILARARAELAMDNPQIASELGYMALRSSPQDSDARDLLVKAVLITGNREDLQNVLVLVNDGVRSDPTDDRLQLARARILMATGQTDSALADLIGFCKTDAGSKSVIAMLSLGELYRLKGDYVASGVQIERAAKLAPGDSSVIRARMVWLGAQKRFDEVSELIDAYHVNEAGDKDVILTAAGILAIAQDIEAKRKALELYYHLTTIAPNLRAAHVGLASMAYQTGDPERAEKIYRDVLNQDPGNIKVINDLAWILQEHRQQYEEALELADKGLLLAPHDKNLLDTRGTILSRIPGRLTDAKKDFASLVELTADGSDARARALLQFARICVQLKDVDEAQGSLKEAVEIDRKNGVFTTKQRSEIERILGN